MADKWVDPVSGDEGNGGTSRTDAYKLIATAIANVGDGDTVWLVEGEYNVTNQSNADFAIALSATKSITFDVDPLNTTDVVVKTYNAYGSVYVVTSTDLSAYTFTFNNIKFNNDRGSGYWVQIQADAFANLVFNDCEFVECAASVNLLTSGAATERKSTVEFNGCTYTADQTPTTNPIRVYSLKSFKMIDCSVTITWESTSLVPFHVLGVVDYFCVSGCTLNFKGHVFYLNHYTEIGTLIIENNTIAKTTLLANPDYVVYTRYANTVNFIRISGNTMTNSVVESANNFRPIQINATTTKLIVENNTITTAKFSGIGIAPNGQILSSYISGNKIDGFTYGIQINVDNVIVCNNWIRCASAIYTPYSTNTYIFNNTLLGLGGGETHGNFRAYYLAIGAASSSETEASFTVNSFTDASEWDLSGCTADLINYRKLTAIVTSSAASTLPLYWGVITAVNDGTNTITVDKWTKCVDGTTGVPAAGTYYVRIFQYPRALYIYNNIMDSRGCYFAYRFENSPYKDDMYIDYNCYTETGHLSNAFSEIYGTTVKTLEDLQAKWALHVSGNTNDAHSVIVDPNFNTDFTIPNSSALIGAGKPTIFGEATTIGASIPPAKQDIVTPYTDRYSTRYTNG